MRLKSLFLFCLLAVGLSVQAKEYKYVSVAGDPMKTRIYTLDNGLKVYLSVNKEKPRIQTYIAVRTGSRNDPAETTGLAHYLEHLMFKGTKSFGTSDPVKEAPLLQEITERYEKYRHLTDPAARKKAYHEIDSVSQIAAKYNIPNEYDKLMAAIGSEGSNAYTSTDVTCYVENIPSNEIENWAKIQSDRFQNMVIRGFHTELEAVYEEYNIGLSNDGRKEWVALNAKLFPNHPYGTQTTIGTQEHLKNPSIVNIQNYFKRYYVPNNVAICMAGDFEPDETIQIIDKYFSGWKKSPNLSRPEYAPVPDLTAHVDTSVVGQEAENIFLGWKFKKASSLQSDTLELISNILYNSKAGLLDTDLNQDMKVMGAQAFYEPMTDYSMLVVTGVPKEKQSLEEVKSLILGEISRLKAGDFESSLLPAIINNMKYDYYNSILKNKNRVEMMKDAFINGINWKDEVEKIERCSKITKEQLVAFANKHFGDNYVCVFKKQGIDKNQKKIEKPEITGIPTNRDKSSQFLRDIANNKVKPIQPKFIDFKKDLTFSKTKRGLPVIYLKNDADGLFSLEYRYEFGDVADTRYNYAANYLEYVGTNKKSLKEINSEFYQIACNFDIRVRDKSLVVRINGLNEYMPQAMALAEDYMQNAQADQKAYNDYVNLIKKAEIDNKASQKQNFNALVQYGMNGKYNGIRNRLSISQLEQTNPQSLLDLIKNLKNLKHTVLYFGADDLSTLNKIVSKIHKTPKQLQDVPANKPYVLQSTSKSEVYIAPYKAKNIYMSMFYNTGKPMNVKEIPTAELFNLYYGGGMNSIAFQELRESRGLAYATSAYYNELTEKGDPTYFTTFIISQNDKLPDCLRVYHQILDSIPQNKAAFDLAKQSLKKQLASERTTRTGLFNAYFFAKSIGLDTDYHKIVYENLPHITMQDILNFGKQNVSNKSFKYIILGDEKELDMKTLEKLGPIHRLSTEEIFGY